MHIFTGVSYIVLGSEKANHQHKWNEKKSQLNVERHQAPFWWSLS